MANQTRFGSVGPILFSDREAQAAVASLQTFRLGFGVTIFLIIFITTFLLFSRQCVVHEADDDDSRLQRNNIPDGFVDVGLGEIIEPLPVYKKKESRETLILVETVAKLPPSYS
ncbi:MAG: hypothetical protein SGCHY_003702 [Lobulomycetales sp.]